MIYEKTPVKVNTKSEQLIKQIQKGVDVQKNCSSLYAKYKDFILWKIRRLGITTEYYADALQDGYFAIMEAATKFDFSAGVAFTTYLVPYILKYVMTPYQNNYTTAGISVSSDLRNIYFKVRKVQKELCVKLQRLPTTKEIAENINISEKRIADALKSSGFIYSLDDKAKKDNDVTIGELICDDNSITEFERVETADVKYILEKSLARLTPTLQKSIKLKFYNDLSYKKIGEIMNISPIQARKNVNAAIIQLRKDNDILSLKNNY